MVNQLALTPETKGCFARQVFRYTQGRLETESDNAILAKAMDDFYNGKWDMRALFKSILTNKSTYLRN